MKIFASTPEELGRLAKGAQYFSYFVAVSLIVGGVIQGKYAAASAVAVLFTVFLAYDYGRLPKSMYGPSSPTGNAVAKVLAVLLLLVVAAISWALSHGA